MERSIDLGDVADRLSEAFPQIGGMYIFGSRAFATGSSRSDIYILIETEDYIRPAELREFASGELTALDLFLVDGGRATSVQNESYVEASDPASLVQLLKAKKFWDRCEGRLTIDVPWKQKIRSDVSFTPTALPLWPSEASEEPRGLEKITFGQLLRATSETVILSAVGIAISLLSAAFYAGLNFERFLRQIMQ